MERCAQHAEATSVRVDDRHSHGGAGTKPEFASGGGGQAMAQRLPHRTYARADAAKTLLGEVAESDLLEVAGVPAAPIAALVAKIGPFADSGAERPRVIAR